MQSELSLALEIFRRYKRRHLIVHYELGVMVLSSIEPSIVTIDDQPQLENLGFFISNANGFPEFFSFKHGRHA